MHDTAGIKAYQNVQLPKFFDGLVDQFLSHSVVSDIANANVHLQEMCIKKWYIHFFVTVVQCKF
jgi:hypothetical protein